MFLFVNIIFLPQTGFAGDTGPVGRRQIQSAPGAQPVHARNVFTFGVVLGQEMSGLVFDRVEEVGQSAVPNFLTVTLTSTLSQKRLPQSEQATQANAGSPHV